MAYIRAISYYLPEQVLTNEELVEEFPEWNIEKIAAKIGVYSRHICAPNETAGDMAEKAALNLFHEYSIKPEEIDFLLFCTQSPDYLLPPTACILHAKLGLKASAGALDYNLGCSGCIYGLALAKSLITSGIAHNVLLLTAETYTKYLHKEDKSNRSIFGDGAAACLISGNGFAEIGDFTLGTDGSGANRLIVTTGGARQREKSDLSHEDADGHIIREDYLYMNGSAVFNFTLDIVPKMVSQILELNGLTPTDIDYYVFHQANKFMLDTIRKVCSISKEKFYIDIQDLGNTVSSSILIALKRCIQSNTIKDGAKVMCCGFGVGLSWGGTILTFHTY